MTERRHWSGWVSDASGPAVHLYADREPTGEVTAMILALRDAVLIAMDFAERQAGRWEDDGGPCGPEHTRTASLLTAGRRVTRLVTAAALLYGVPVWEFPAEWDVHADGWCHCRRPGRYCPAAGPRRNRQMLDEARPTRVLAFTDSFADPRSGTRHMCRIAVAAGVPVTLVEHGPGGMCSSRDLGEGDFA